MDEARERREAIRQLHVRLFVACLLLAFTVAVQAGLEFKKMKTEHVAIYLAWDLNLIVMLCIARVMIGIALLPEPVVVERLRRTIFKSDFFLVIASGFVLISLSCLAFHRFFVV